MKTHRVRVVLCLLLATAGCSQIEQSRNEDRENLRQAAAPSTGFECLAAVGEVADDPLHAAAGPTCRVGRLDAVRVEGRPVPGVAVIERGPVCRPAAGGMAIDLSASVVARVYRDFQLEPGFVPLVQSPSCPSLDAGVADPALPAGSTALLELTTVATVPTTSAAGVAYRLPAAVAGRLVEARNGRVLWQDTCRTDTSELKAAATFPDTPNLERVLAHEADRCAQGFAAALGAPTSL
ncbi:MAG: hypothetical protein ACJ8H8_01725 [Geminicoccaceae bacterium]